MKIYQDNNQISRSVDVYIENGKFTVSEYDLEPKVFDQERIAETKQIDRLKSVFGAKTEDELLLILKEKFGTNDAFDQIVDIFSAHKIKYDYWSFTS